MSTDSHPADRRLLPGSKTAYRFRGVLVAAPAVAAFCVPPHVVSPDLWVGMGLIGVGWMVRVWAQMHLGYRLRRRMALVTCGPFRCCRNPIYLANTAIVLGVVLASEAPWPWIPAAAVWCAVVFRRVVDYEEFRLRRTYGEAYRGYCHAVARWWSTRPFLPAHCAHALTQEALLAESIPPFILVPVFVRAMFLGYL
jgi:protein-S-isoprenylcysteine O-methyltransferase Ste14